MFEQLGVIGCGLMGGSFALALKRAGLVKRVVGYSKSPTTTERARQLGVIDVEAPSALLAVSGADIVLIAVPVAATEATLKSIKHMVTPQMLVMDVGSTKGDVLDAARRALRDQMGSSHDAAFAAVSHLPHLLAFALMNAITSQEQAAHFLSLAGPGFRDFTRIAASDPKVWRDILLANRKELLEQSRFFQEQLKIFENLMAQEDAQGVEQLITQASASRAAWHLKHHNKPC